MRDNARRLVFIQHFARPYRVICAAMHREKFEVQGFVKDNSKNSVKRNISILNRVPSIILTRRYHFYHLTYRKRHRVKINDNSRLTTLCAKERAFVTSHVNIYVRGKGVHSRMLQQCKFSFLYRVRIEIILLYCELSLINACCCRADATINSLRLRRRELIFIAICPPTSCINCDNSQ